ncbi:hypothetical protein F4808DRAFT_461324 [Astrocystis sublimbata]|nr:hypothetical protein F4808DRAFT_461324 [Astrocystis sublimbata]
MQPGRYPRILPATPASQETPAAEAPGASGITEKGSKKRQLTQPRPGACIECRARKTKCDGVRPGCGNCTKRGISECLYPERLTNGPKALELVDLLRALPDDRSISLLKRIREGADLAKSISLYKDSGDDLEPPSRPVSQRPRRDGSLEGELMRQYPNSFPELPPIDPIRLATSDLLRPQPGTSSAAPLAGQDGETYSAIPSHFTVDDYDERLAYLQVGFWTQVKIPDEFAARVISLYLKTDHPLLGLFDSHLFIDDLINKRSRYCSTFLFHALMYLGCQMYSAIDKKAMQYAGEFCQIAEKMGKDESDSYASMAGAIFLSISLMGHGKDHAVLKYAAAAMQIGTRLGLFSDIIQLPAGTYTSLGDEADEERSAQSYAAWGVFNWNVMVSMFYRQPGSQTPASAPTVPIPGELGDRPQQQQPSEMNGTDGVHEGHEAQDGDGYENGYHDDDDSEEEVDGYEEDDGNPSDDAVLRRTFPVLCNFWRIVYKCRWIYYVVQESPPLFLRHTLVEYAYRELIAWVETLPHFLRRREGSPHYVIVFHIWLHTAILDMWQPFIRKAAASSAPAPQSLHTFVARHDRTADAAYTASVQQLKHLVITYRSRHTASTYSILWHNGLIYLVNAMLRCVDPHWRLYLLLCLYGYERLRRPYRISEVVTQGLLTMTMRDTDMSGEEAYKIMEELKGRGLVDFRGDLEEEIRATFMVDLKLALTDPEAARAETMAKEFDGMAAFQDLVDPDAMETP